MAGDNQILVHALGFYVGMLLSQFCTALIRDLLLPLLSPVASVEGGISQLIVTVFGIKFNVGDVIVNTLNLVIALVIISYAIPYFKDYVPVVGRR